MSKHAVGNIFLIGAMGAGKTTIGKQLALTLEREFLDSDREIEERTGASISLIFDLEGEAGFRRRERDMIDELTRRHNIVLATGGGAILYPHNRLCLAQRGCVVYLQATVDQLLRRTRGSTNRPLLQTPNPRERLEQILDERGPLYLRLADIVIETCQHTVKQVASEILAQMGVEAVD
jgi:shikimate kinase